ncbi:MAG: thioredoxin family protein, partial [Planctomycetota bacterium]|nr:thioredoxin family protein [Planctomycetota bacterium]
MKQLFVLLVFTAILAVGCGEGATPSKRKKPPILKPRVQWQVSYPDAVKMSKQTGKPIFAFFTGSDWCKYCELLDHQILNTEIFANWAKANVVLLELDFPEKKELDPEIKK